MSLRALRLASAALIGAALLVPAAADAQRRPGPSPRPDYAERMRDRAGYLRDSHGDERDRATSRRADYRQSRAERCDGGGAGSILGAIAGGLLGTSAIDRHPGRPAGTLVSAERDCD